MSVLSGSLVLQKLSKSKGEFIRRVRRERKLQLDVEQRRRTGSHRAGSGPGRSPARSGSGCEACGGICA